MKETMGLLYLVFLLLNFTFAYSKHIDVTSYGAIGDGRTDDTQAFKDAWETTCGSSGSLTMKIPAGRTFLLQPLTLKGPCKSDKIHVEVNGNIVAPGDPSDWNCREEDCSPWIRFYKIDGLYIYGSGTIDGRGSKWWDLDCHHKHKHGCLQAPTAMVLAGCTNAHVSGLTFKDSPQMHIGIEHSTMVHLFQIYIVAPGDSPNTDGVHIQGSKYVYVENSHIGTGDDCVSIGAGSSYINVTTVTCGPGHGISIGSLGKGGEAESVKHVHVKNAQFTRTTNGIRIKTWQGGKGHAEDIIFEEINFDDVHNPIIIDQYYCDSSEKCKIKPSAVKVSHIRYIGVYGTSRNEVAVNFDCSDTVGCTDIKIDNMNITSIRDGYQTSSYCRNAHGTVTGKVVPMVSCLVNS